MLATLRRALRSFTQRTGETKQLIYRHTFQVKENYADAVVLHPTDFIRAHEQQLKKIMKEVIDPERVYAVVADKDINPDVLKKANV